MEGTIATTGMQAKVNESVTASTTAGCNNQTINSYDTDDYVYDTLLYQGFSFERPIYLYIWEILVIMTFLFNCVVISVLMNKKMRNTTFMILVAISISDSMTGLVTLPTYIAVFGHYSPTAAHGEISQSYNKTPDCAPVTEAIPHDYYDYFNDLYKDIIDKIDSVNGTANKEHRIEVAPDGYFISEELCDGFMISKFFLSKSFHTMSVWLTLFLGLQRFLTVYSPFQGLARMFTTKTIIIVCVSIFLLAPILHVYHLFKDKSTANFCKWRLDDDCGPDCVYLWFVLLLGHLLPALFLIVFTVLFVNSLGKTLHSLQTAESSRKSTIRKSTLKSMRKSSINTTLQMRERENRRVSIIVTAIVIVFLIPEVPYSCFLLYNVISAHAALKTSLRFNRAIHAAYEILLVLSFNANFYIYTFLNQRFRRILRKSILAPIYNATCARLCSGATRLSTRMSRSSMSSTPGSRIQMTQVQGQHSTTSGHASSVQTTELKGQSSTETIDHI